MDCPENSKVVCKNRTEKGQEEGKATVKTKQYRRKLDRYKEMVRVTQPAQFKEFHLRSAIAEMDDKKAGGPDDV